MIEVLKPIKYKNKFGEIFDNNVVKCLDNRNKFSQLTFSVIPILHLKKYFILVLKTKFWKVMGLIKSKI